MRSADPEVPAGTTATSMPRSPSSLALPSVPAVSTQMTRSAPDSAIASAHASSTSPGVAGRLGDQHDRETLEGSRPDVGGIRDVADRHLDRLALQPTAGFRVADKSTNLTLTVNENGHDLVSQWGVCSNNEYWHAVRLLI